MLVASLTRELRPQLYATRYGQERNLHWSVCSYCNVRYCSILHTFNPQIPVLMTLTPEDIANKIAIQINVKLRNKTMTDKINKIKAEIANQVKRKELHTRNAQASRESLLALIPEDKRSAAIYHIGEFADRVRHVEKASEAIFNLYEQQRKLDSKRPQWMSE